MRYAFMAGSLTLLLLAGPTLEPMIPAPPPLNQLAYSFKGRRSLSTILAR